MRVFVFIFILSTAFVSCETKEENTTVQKSVVETQSADSIIEVLPVIYSEIRRGDTIAVGEVYVDTLTFLSFNSDYDYYYGEFETSLGDTVTLVYGELMDDKNVRRKLVAQWEMDSLYEAGENDELYLQERLIGFEVIRDLEIGFAIYLNAFSTPFLDLGADMEQFLHADIGFYYSINPGVYCVMNKVDSVEKLALWFNSVVVANETPVGDFCEGYADVESGFYYKRMLPKDLPTFISPGEDGVQEYKYEIPERFKDNELMQVTVINEEYHRAFLYFIQIDNQWYFFAQDYCDCSA